MEDLSKQINEETVQQPLDPSLVESQNEQTSLEMRNKKKRRFKNFRGTETEYLKAVCADLIRSDVEMPQDAPRSSPEIVSSGLLEDGTVVDVGSNVADVKSADAEPYKSASSEIAGKDVESPSGEVKAPENRSELSGTMASINEVDIDRGDYSGSKTKDAIEVKEKEPRGARLQKSKHEVQESAVEPSVVGRKVEGSIAPKENKASNKDNDTSNVRELRRKERKTTSFKPKDINLTDSWFVTSSKATKRTASHDKNRNTPKAAGESTNAKPVRSVINSNIDVGSDEHTSKTRAPTIGKFIPVENRKSMTRRRRLKNVSGDIQCIHGLSKGTEEFGKDSQTRGVSQKPPTSLGDGNSQVDSSSNAKPNDSSHGRNLFSSVSNSSKEECSTSKGEKIEARGLSEVSVEVTRVDSLMSTGLSLNKCTNENGTVVDNRQSSNYSSGAVKKLLHEPDLGLFDSFRTKTEEVNKANVHRGSVNNRIEKIDILTGGNVDQGSQFKADLIEVKLDGQSKDEGDITNKKERTKPEEASTIEVTFSTPVEMIKGRPLVVSSLKAREESHIVREGEKQLSSLNHETVSIGSDSSITQSKPGEDANGGKVCERSPCRDREDFKERGIVDLTKIGRKINRRFSKVNDKDAKNLKSGKSFFIKAPVDDKEKQVTVKPIKPDMKKSAKNLADYESDTDIDITAIDKDIGSEKEDSGKDAKVKRKIYTVVRKIRRTEITADGKKVTKIIKQIVKKVCPVANDQSGASAPAAKKRATMEKKVNDGDDLAEKPVESKAESPGDGTVKSALDQRCGKCEGCLRKDDCKQCEACRCVFYIKRQCDNKFEFSLFYRIVQVYG